MNERIPVTVTACPLCGIESPYACYHPNRDWKPVEMPIEKAIELVRSSIRHAQSKAETFRGFLEVYQKRAEASLGEGKK